MRPIESAPATKFVMPGQKRQRVRAKRGPMTGSARLRAGCPGYPRLDSVAARKTWMAGHRRAEATPSFGRLCPAMTKKRILSIESIETAHGQALRSARCTVSGTRAKTDNADNKTGSSDLPVGRFVDRDVQPPLQKYFGFRTPQITSRTLAIPSHTEGRFAIVTDVGAGCGGRGSVLRAMGSQDWSKGL